MLYVSVDTDEQNWSLPVSGLHLCPTKSVAVELWCAAYIGFANLSVLFRVPQ
jgi:hypothetical protein